MTTEKLKLVPGKLYSTGDRREYADFVNETETGSIIIPANSVIMYIETPKDQPRDHCNGPCCRSSTNHHFLFEDKLVMIFNAEEYISPISLEKTKALLG